MIETPYDAIADSERQSNEDFTTLWQRIVAIRVQAAYREGYRAALEGPVARLVAAAGQMDFLGQDWDVELEAAAAEVRALMEER